MWATLSVSALAATINIGWDASPAADQVTKYVIYEQVGTNWVKLGEVNAVPGTPPTYAIQNATIGVHTYAVAAVNVWGESTKSTPITTPPSAGTPANVRVITVTVTVQ